MIFYVDSDNLNDSLANVPNYTSPCYVYLPMIVYERIVIYVLLTCNCLDVSR